MDMFTDVDIFKDVLDAAARRVPVYIVLDYFNFKHFTTMCERQGIHLQRLMNIRIRTVKGLDYLCRSGSKFHGKMMEKFLLVDCKTVVYGTYSFMWSFEKINLSMVQVISGHLVESYDEEFRTLYARSDIPTMFITESSGLLTGKRPLLILQNGINRDIYQRSVTSIASSSSQQKPFNRMNPARHTLDTWYQKFYGRYHGQQNEREGINKQSNIRNLHLKPYITTDMDATNRIGHLQNYEGSDYWKRHSYAGEQQETLPYLLLNRSTNHRPLFQRSSHNLMEENESIGSSFRGELMPQSHRKNFGQRIQGRIMPTFERSSNIRTTYHGPKTLHLPPTHKLPTLESMKRAGLRNRRIESYLNDPAAPSTNSVTDPFELTSASRVDRVETSINHRMQGHLELMGRTEMKTNPNHWHSRLHTSLVYKSPLSGMEDTDSHNSESSTSTRGTDSGSIHSQGLATNKSVHSLFNADKSNSSEYLKVPVLEKQTTVLSSYQSDAELNQISMFQRQHSFNQRFQTHLNDQRSMTKPNFNSTVSRTLSIPSLSHTKGNETPGDWPLDRNGKKLEQHSTFIRRSSDKIKSLLNITHDRRDHGLRSRGSAGSSKMNSSSTDTLTSEDDHSNRNKITMFSGNKQKETKASGSPSTSTNTPQVTRSDKHVQPSSNACLREINFKSTGNESAPRFSTEESPIRPDPVVSYSSHIKSSPEQSQVKITTTKTQFNPNDHRVYSRFERLCTTQKNKSTPEEVALNPLPMHPAPDRNNASVHNSLRSSSKLLMPQGNHAPRAVPRNENKFEKFMQKVVGSFRPKK
ncbi:protein FAM83B isoform X2 [Narcine bancroftii]